MQISIIIINFNTLIVTLNCLSSIKEYCQNLDYEIILIDNAPKANYETDFLSIDPNIQYIKSEKNIGFGAANNLGMSKAKGQYFLLLNSDTLFTNNSLKNCFDYLELNENQEIGMLGCKLLNKDGSYQDSFYPFIKDSMWNYLKSNNPLLYKTFSISKKFQEPTEIKQVGDISGAFMLLRKDVFFQTGGFDPDFFLYCEETEWCRNRITKQYKICYYPDANIIHLGGQSAPKDAMLIQSSISLALYWYKRSVILLPLFILVNLINAAFYSTQYLFCDKIGKANIRKWLSKLWVSLPYWIFHIPKYPRGYGKRDQALIYEGARAIFFES
ncbi:MAG: glycosyltransferase family 2 protein [Limnohabitans sp.]|nr:glycosyltransferase family 2 protein [Limnohabitans sp.]